MTLPPTLPFSGLVPGRFLCRPNRFIAEVMLDDTASRRDGANDPVSWGRLGAEIATVHVPTTGRMSELLVEGARVHLMPAHNTDRVTGFDLVLVEAEEGLVCIDSRVSNRLMARHWTHELGPTGLAVHSITTEPRYGRGRFDFLLVDALGPLLVEVKSVTLVRDGVALFPDAPTARGRRHLDSLVDHVRKGGRAAAVFVVQRQDASAMAPNGETDPAFRDTFYSALDAGVLVAAHSCEIGVDGVSVASAVPVVPRAAGSM